MTTDKLLVFAGRPTQIVANLHAHRHELGDIAAKLAIAASVQQRHVQRGYARVLPAASDGSPLPIVSPKTCGHK